jgi:hypothetical protein
MKVRKKAIALTQTQHQQTELVIDQIQQMKKTVALAAADLKQLMLIVTKTASSSI